MYLHQPSDHMDIQPLHHQNQPFHRLLLREFIGHISLSYPDTLLHTDLHENVGNLFPAQTDAHHNRHPRLRLHAKLLAA